MVYAFLAMDKETDENLISGYLKGDKSAFEELVKRYMKPVYSFICRNTGSAKDAEDITQEVFVRVWKNVKKFDKDKSFKTWIFSIAKNASIDFLRKKKTLPFSAFEDSEGKNTIIENLVDSAFSLPEFLKQKDISKMIISAVNKLPKKYQEILSLRYNSELSFREISLFSGESINTVKSRHRRALIALRKILS